MKNFRAVILFRIVLMFAVMFVMTFIPENWPNLFGDWNCQGAKRINLELVGCYYEGSSHAPTTHWGARHWIWFCCGGLIFIAQIIFLITDIEKYSKGK